MVRPILKEGTVTIPRAATLRIESVDIADISLPDNHCAMDYHQANIYADIVRGGVLNLQPILLFEEDGRFWLIGGRHRFVGTILAGQQTVLALVTDKLTILPS